MIFFVSLCLDGSRKRIDMAIENDEFGHDPSVQRTRKIFSSMEKAQWELLEKLKISPFDDRLRSIRKKALDLFGKSFPIAISKGIDLNEDASAGLYAFCLAQSLKPVGFDVPDNFLPDNKQLETIVMETIS